MKKKILNVVASLVLVLITAVTFAACGQSSKMKISLQKFNDDMIFQVVATGIPSGTKAEDIKADTALNHATLYYLLNCEQPTYQTYDWEQDKYDVCLEVSLDKPEKFEGMSQEDIINATMSIGDLKVEVNGQSYDFVASDSAEGQAIAAVYNFTPSDHTWYALIENVASSVEFKFTGHAKLV